MKRNFLIEKKRIVKKIIHKEKMKTTQQLFCVAEVWMLLEGGVLYGFTRKTKHNISIDDINVLLYFRIRM